MRFPTAPRRSYLSDLTDAQWSLLEPLLPPEVEGLGRPREVDDREVINAILYLNRSGCQWDMLPHDLPPKSTTYEYHNRGGMLSMRARYDIRCDLLTQLQGARSCGT